MVEKPRTRADETEIRRRVFTLANTAEVSADNRRVCPLCGRASRNVNSLRLHIVRNHAEQIGSTSPMATETEKLT